MPACVGNRFPAPTGDAGDWSHPLLQPALTFAQSELVLIGAPYWDLSFPAALKIWVENMYVRNLTFRYTPEGEPQCLTRVQRSAYITTAGSPIGDHDWGYRYMQAVLGVLGRGECISVRAEGLDIAGWDAEGRLRRAEDPGLRALRHGSSRAGARPVPSGKAPPSAS